MVEGTEEEANGIPGGKQYYFRNTTMLSKQEERKVGCIWFSHLRVEKAKSELNLCMDPVSQGSNPQRRSSFPREERERKQEASERSTVQLGMALERNLWEQNL